MDGLAGCQPRPWGARFILSMLGTQGIETFVKRFLKCLIKIAGVYRFPADLTPHQIQGDHMIPLVLHEMLKFDSPLRTYAPALTAPGALGHIVQQASTVAGIFKSESGRRAVLYARQTSVALFIYDEIRHG